MIKILSGMHPSNTKSAVNTAITLCMPCAFAQVSVVLYSGQSKNQFDCGL